MAGNDIERARDALRFIPPDLPRDKWHKVGRALISVGMTIDDIDEWSSPASNYKGLKDVASAFRNITPEGGTGPGTLFAIAREYGYEPNGKPMQRPAQAPRKAAVPSSQPEPGKTVAEVWSRCERAFANPNTGKPYVSIFWAWDAARNKADLADVRVHDLRHSTASFLVNAGRTLYEVQHILGHTQVKTTQRYAHLSHDTLLDATNSVNTALGGMFMPMVSASPAAQVQLVQ